MIGLWLRSGEAGIILIPFIALYLIATAIVWLTHLSPARPFFASCIGIAGPFFASVAVLFGLFSAFLANDVQHRNADIKAAIFSEADGVRTILRLAEALGEPGKPVIAAALAYAQSVIAKEFPPPTDEAGVVENLGALRNLVAAVLAPGLTAALPTAAHQEMLDGLVEIRQVRRVRLTLMAGVSDPMNWLAMLVLGVLTQVAIGVVQLDKMRPQALALFVFTTAFAATAVIIATAEHRSPGGDIDPAPLRAAIASATP